MDIKSFSKEYIVKRLGEGDIGDIFTLCSANKMYYEYCPPMVTEESIIRDMKALPPHKTLEDKYYIGYYIGKKLVAVLDLIEGYPKDKTIFIGFFMVDCLLQKKGLGTAIISELCSALKREGMHGIQLAWVKGNPQAEYFWKKNNFIIVKEAVGSIADSVLLAERIL